MERVIGLTGGIGSGKSAAAEFLKKNFGGKYIDADHICHELLQHGNKGWHALKKEFGNEYFNHDLTVNRQLLRENIFRNEELRLRINTLLHPLAREAITQSVRHAGNATQQQPFYSNAHSGQKPCDSSTLLMIIVEVPLLFEAAWETNFDRIVVIYANQRQCRERLMKRDKISLQEANAAIATQCPLASKVLRADHVIDNSGSWFDTCLQLLHLGKVLLDREDVTDHEVRPPKKRTAP